MGGLQNTPSMEGLRQTLEAVHAAGGLIIGSLGRAAMYRSLGADPLVEFAARGEQLLVNSDGEPRDVDAIGVDIDALDHLATQPHLVDITSFCRAGHLLARSARGRWRFQGFTGTAQEVDARCFESLESEVNGIRCITVRPATHLALLPSSFRAKDKHLLAYQILKEHLPEDEKEFLLSGAYAPLWRPPIR